MYVLATTRPTSAMLHNARPTSQTVPERPRTAPCRCDCSRSAATTLELMSAAKRPMFSHMQSLDVLTAMRITRRRSNTRRLMVFTTLARRGVRAPEPKTHVARRCERRQRKVTTASTTGDLAQPLRSMQARSLLGRTEAELLAATAARQEAVWSSSALCQLEPRMRAEIRESRSEVAWIVVVVLPGQDEHGPTFSAPSSTWKLTAGWRAISTRP
mmetsp:Transcript_112424/g.314146  ORF Transcript_112424/g.314146 Transcript_112424/m.314146 type:complete len:214 (+) Transcript_112424:1053-1694(+)